MAESSIRFPNYLQTRKFLPPIVWHLGRLLSVIILIGFCFLCFWRPVLALDLLWGLLVPVLPLVFFAAPGLWRNLCPLAAMNQVPRLFGFAAAWEVSSDVRRYANIIGMSLLFAIVPARKWFLDNSAEASALLILIALTLAFLGGLLFRGKSGWCGSICPLLPIQRAYGQTPLVTVSNSHCQPCVGCTKNCYDFNPHVAYLADLYDSDTQLGADRRLFIGAIPGFIWAFFTLPDYPAIGIAELYLSFIFYSLASAGSFFALETYLKVSPHKVTALYTFISLNLFYWFAAPIIADTLQEISGITLAQSFATVLQACVLIATVLWFWLTYRKESMFLEQAFATTTTRVADDAVLVRHRETHTNNYEVTLLPENKTLLVEPQSTLLDILETREVTIEAGCRMGVCGSDPITVVEGAENLTPPSDDEKATLERLGAGANTRMACCAKVCGNVKLTLGIEKAALVVKSEVDFEIATDVSRIVIIGNGIAGVTAADYIRRHHDSCELHLIGRETHPLYNRMGIYRLIYGRSAMQGLYLLPNNWYQERNITPWLNTHVSAIDFDANKVHLGTGEELAYDRLILAMGSSGTIPTPLQEFRLPGAFVLREADDAMEIRGYLQRHACTSAVVAGGGLLGLEAAYALHQVGLNVTVLERSEYILRRQLDRRSSELLQAYMERMGINVMRRAEAVALHGQERLQHVNLKGGRQLKSDIVLIAAGISPNVDLLEDSGLQINRGVKVDDQMRTSKPEVFAVGDIAEPETKSTGSGLWPVAVEQGRVAGLNAIGGQLRYSAQAPVVALKVVGVDVTSIGIIEGVGAGVIEIALEDETEHHYRKLVIQGNRIIGAILLGYPEYADWVKQAIHEAWDISDRLDDLRSGDWDKSVNNQAAA